MMQLFLQAQLLASKSLVCQISGLHTTLDLLPSWNSPYLILFLDLCCSNPALCFPMILSAYSTNSSPRQRQERAGLLLIARKIAKSVAVRFLFGKKCSKINYLNISSKHTVNLTKEIRPPVADIRILQNFSTLAFEP